MKLPRMKFREVFITRSVARYFIISSFLFQHDQLSSLPGSEQEFIFLRLSVLREYLERELSMPNLPFTQNMERAIDDWVFMCFFVGNDFLPHLPSLEIREGAIDRLVKLYKKAVYKTGGYLTDSGTVNLARVQLVMQGVIFILIVSCKV